MSADWVPAEGAEHEGSWLVSGDDAVHALLDDALRALGAPVGDGVAGGRLHGPVRSSDRLGDVHASLGELDRRVDSVYGQAVREAHAEIVSVSNAMALAGPLPLDGHFLLIDCLQERVYPPLQLLVHAQPARDPRHKLGVGS